MSGRCFWCLVVSVTCIIPTSLHAQAAKPRLLAGAYAQEITPERFPISVNGNMTDVQATAAHDPLHARCIVLKSTGSDKKADTTLAIVVCDSCAIPRDLMDRAKTIAASRTGIQSSHILISATHAHSCPTVTSAFQSEPDKDYVEFMITRIAQGIENALQQLEPAKVGWGSVAEPSLLFNRRWYLKDDATVVNPFGKKSDRVVMNPGFNNALVRASVDLIDPDVSFLSIQSQSGRPIALLANYSLHYIGGVPGNTVSADYFGEFAERLGRLFKTSKEGPAFVGIMSNGTSGDVNNIDFRLKLAPQKAPFEQIAFAAEILAQDVFRACSNIPYHDSLPLAVQETEIELGVRKPTATELNEASEMIKDKPTPLREMPLIYARETTLLAQYPSTVKAKLQAMRIGDLAIATSPCETFTETGLAIKKASPMKQTFTISLANGYNGYLPPPEQHNLGGYETWRARSSYLAVDAEPQIRSTIIRLLNQLRD